jgi:hypothetical protein
LRRAEILADLQAQTLFGSGEIPTEEWVAQSQVGHVGLKQARASLAHTLNQAGYKTAEQWSELMHQNPVEFQRLALTSRQQTVIHDGYEQFLADGGTPQTENAAARIEAAKVAVAGSEENIRAFLSAERGPSESSAPAEATNGNGNGDSSSYSNGTK